MIHPGCEAGNTLGCVCVGVCVRVGVCVCVRKVPVFLTIVGPHCMCLHWRPKLLCVALRQKAKCSFLTQRRAKRKAKMSSIHGNLKKKTCLQVYSSGKDTPRD